MATNTIPTKQTHTAANNNSGNTSGPYAISFDYLSESDVEVRVTNTLKTQTTHYTFPTKSTIQFTSNNFPPLGATIEIKRNTNITTPKVDFEDGSVLTESDLDNNSKHILFGMQETKEDTESLVSTFVGASAPTGIANGARWYDTISGRTFIYYVDADSAQWVEANPPFDATEELDTTKLSFTHTGTGAVSRTVDSKLEDTISVRDFGATIDGNDDATAINNAKTRQGVQGGPLFVPAGNVDVGGTDYTNLGGLTYYNDSFSGGVNFGLQARKTLILLTAETSTNTTKADEHTRVPLSVTINGKGAQHATGVRSNLVNQSTDGDGNTAFYGRATNYTTAFWGAAIHGETRHNGGTSIGISSENAGYSTSGNMYGVTSHITTGTSDTHPQDSSASDASPSNRVGFITLGSDNTDGDSGVGNHGRWKYGIQVKDNSVATDGIGILIQGSQSGSGSITKGIDLTGTYTTSAINIPVDQKIRWGTGLGTIQGVNNVGLELSSSNQSKIRLYSTAAVAECHGNWRPNTDGARLLGAPTHRWSQLYASTSTINTSDENEKQDIRDATDAEKKVAVAIKSLFKMFRFKDAVAAKGDNARLHYGVIAQSVETAFKNEGLDPEKYALFCKDTWTDETTGNEITRLGIRYSELLAFVISTL